MKYGILSCVVALCLVIFAYLLNSLIPTRFDYMIIYMLIFLFATISLAVLIFLVEAIVWKWWH